VCHLQLQTRPGPYSVKLGAAKSFYSVGEPVTIRLTVQNVARSRLFVDPSAQVRDFSLHMIAPGYKSTEPDRRLPTNGETLKASETLRLPARVLQAWGCSLTRPGTYRFNLSFGAVDSNVVAFTIR
jgi:hypothetical protein